MKARERHKQMLDNGNMLDSISHRVNTRLRVMGMTADEACAAAGSPRDGRWLLSKTSRSGLHGIAEAASVLGISLNALIGVRRSPRRLPDLKEQLDNELLTPPGGADDG